MPLPVDKAIRKAQKHLKAGKVDEAEALYKDVLSRFPKNKKAIQGYQKLQNPPQISVDQIIALYNQGQLEKAVLLSENLARQYPNALILYDLLGAAHMGLGNAKNAIENYHKALRINPNHTDAYNNLGLVLYDQGKFNEAVESYQKAIKLEPSFADLHYNLGNALKQKGELDQSIESYKVSLLINPNDTDVLLNYGNALKDYGDLDQAIEAYVKALEISPLFATAQNNMDNAIEEKIVIERLVDDYARLTNVEIGSAEIFSFIGFTLKAKGYVNAAIDNYKKAIKIKPDCVTYYDLGVTLQDKGDSDAAINCYKEALKIQPDYAEAYNNMGVALQDRGDLEAAIDSYKRAIKIKPDYADAWTNIAFSLQAMKLLNSEPIDLSLLSVEFETCNYTQVALAILKYRLDLGSESTENSLKNAISMLSVVGNNSIQNPDFKNSECQENFVLTEKITALVHFGRPGTGLLHSLIDSHSDVSTLPSIYFSEFFGHDTWKKITVGGWSEMIERFILIYEVLFDASSPVPVASHGGSFINDVGQKEGMTNVGEHRNEILSVDKCVFRNELNRLISFYSCLDALNFFKLVHTAYEKALNDQKEKKLIFYHIHNPDYHAQLNFIRLSSKANWIMMVREPLQSCESWVKSSFIQNDYLGVEMRIFQMLFQVDSVIFRNETSIGLRLEDLKEHPQKTVSALCNWLGIKEEDSLYEMTAQGKKWWGGPTADFTKDGIDPFGKTAINRKLGSVFTKKDQFILSTLFYPFSVRFGYLKENASQFKIDLLAIRPMLDQIFDFEKKILEHSDADAGQFMKSGAYLHLRSGMLERWNTLNTFHTYPNMLKPLKIN